jgi:hypothetical protein
MSYYPNSNKKLANVPHGSVLPLCAIMYRFILIALIILIHFCGCKADKCSKDIDSWISLAPRAYQDFELAKSEILNNRDFVKAHTSQGVLFLGLNLLDTGKISEAEMPHLKNWFRNGHGYISIREDDTTACFKQCSNGRHLAYGILEHQNNRREHPRTRIFTDSIKVSDTYRAFVFECVGCEE